MAKSSKTLQPNESTRVSVKPYGKTADGQKVSLYTLTNANGMKATVATFGATLIDLWVPDRNGVLADVSLGFGSIRPYLNPGPYFGCTVGRFANRIAKGKFRLGGKLYKLAANNGVNHLHGGIQGFDKQVWNAEIVDDSKQAAVRFSRLSPDGEEGYPGNLEVSVTYTLTDSNELRLSYSARTDKLTVINLTNHTYFNLAGASHGSVLDHKITIHADRFTAVGKTLMPTGKLQPVEGTPLDLRKPTVIGSRIPAVGGDPIGFDHNFVLNKYPTNRPALAAEVYEPTSGRLMKVYTDQPGVQFYTGNFLDGSVKGKGGKTYRQHAGFCLETQHFPDSPNQPEFPSTELKPGEVFKSTTVYKFSAK